MNVQFEKRVEKSSSNNSSIIITSEVSRDESSILSIAKESFVFSRFFNDPNLRQEQSRLVYVKWVENSVKTPSKLFVLVKELESIKGFIIFNVNRNNGIATIELIAVDKDTLGKGYGRAMIKALESYLFNLNISHLKVGTQTDNIRAVNFYSSLGFDYIACNSVYHLWL